VTLRNGPAIKFKKPGICLSISFLRVLWATVAFCAWVGAGEMASAQQKIGSAAEVINNVTGEASGVVSPLKLGDPVFLNEIVRTAAASMAKLVFLDLTYLRMAQNSEMTLNAYVYQGPLEPASTQKMSVILTRGVFRFTSGRLDKKAYLISTPNAVITLGGTVLDILIRSGVSRATLREGLALVCPRGAGVDPEQQKRNCAKPASGKQAAACGCVELSPGQTAEVKPVGGVTRATLASTSADFASTIAPFPRGALCGH
jgi:hypothetical protein